MRFAPVLLLILFVASPTIAQTTSPRTISVSGEAEIRVVPDELVLQLAVETRDPDLQSATATNQATVEAIKAVAVGYGVPEERIQTDRLDLRPQYLTRRLDNDTSVPFLYQYHVLRSVTITLRQLDVFDELIRDAVAAGANEVNGVTFRSTELRTHRDEARLLAIDAAREKAEALAGRLGQTIGRPISISEQTFGGYGGWFNGGGGTQNVIQSSGAASFRGDGATSPGQIPIRATVSVVFELAD